MALFQPTNITPDLKGGVKNGVILIPAGTITPTSAEISWSVNGNSKMTAYQIDFYQNTAASTQTGTTGKITLGTPFSAISADGTAQRFTVTVAWSLISDTYSGTSTRQGKFKITQWWGSGASDYVEQRSLSVFEVSHEGSISITSVSGYGGYVTCAGIYSPPVGYGDIPLNWIRWEIYIGAVGGTPIYDSGKVWNATDYTWSPPALSPGDYVARFSAEAANGASYVDAEFFSVSEENVTTIDNMLTVACDHEHDAVKISVENSVEYISPDVYGVYQQEQDGALALANSSSGATYPVLDYSSDAWTFIWHGTIDGAGSTVFRIRLKSGEDVKVAQNSGYLVFTTGTSTHQLSYATGREYWIIFTTGYFTGGVTTGFQWLVYSPAVSGYQNWQVTTWTLSRPMNIDLYGPCTVYGFQLGFGYGNSDLAAGMTDQSAQAIFGGPKVSFPFDADSINAEWLPLGTENGQGVLYRTEGEYQYGAAMTLIGKFPPYDDVSFIPYILDYAALNGQNYTYLVTGADEDLENEAISKSQSVTPCFWNWLLIEAAQDADNKNLYEAVKVFRFIGNVSSGTYGNGGGRNIQPTFTQYPVILRSTQNRRQGTLAGLIGYTVRGEYFDTNETEQALRALSTSRNQLFLRDRRGNFMKIALAGEISMSVNDNTMKQEITASVPWIEMGSAAGISVYETGYDDNHEPEE